MPFLGYKIKAMTERAKEVLVTGEASRKYGDIFRDLVWESRFSHSPESRQVRRKDPLREMVT